ncbi:MAG: prepilin-type N-terminal cleavage/methylation domain-containing protein [Epsilonproteobacteria bacterium]|nr:prepilin-type N-terminal cleavage/methylation domain-containing protein [Campylobacterota bacterium]
MKKSFTLLELVIVLVVIGILASVAVPKLIVTRDDAAITKARVDVATIRSAILNYKTRQLMQGSSDLYPSTLDDAQTNKEHEKLFDKLLNYPIYSQDAKGHWMKVGDTNYTFKIQNKTIQFDYHNDSGIFDCSYPSSSTVRYELCNKISH